MVQTMLQRIVQRNGFNKSLYREQFNGTIKLNCPTKHSQEATETLQVITSGKIGRFHFKGHHWLQATVVEVMTDLMRIARL